MQLKNKDLKKRIVDISYKKGLSHIGSCLASIDVIEDIYKKKKPNDKFVLSNGHAGLALYVVLEKYFAFMDAEKLFDKHGVHPNRDIFNYIDCSSGSLGHGVGIAVGMALADRTREVYCTISDGEYMEGSVHEALRIQKDLYLANLHIYCIINGYSAYQKLNPMRIANELEYNTWCHPVMVDMYGYPTWLQTQEGHYRVLSKEDYEEMMAILA